MHIFLNALGAACASGFTYVRNVLPHLCDGPPVHTTIAVNRKLRSELPELHNISFLENNIPANPARRFWFEQTVLPGLVRRSGADVLISAGNFAMRNCPVPQILLSGNSLYTSQDFSCDLRSRGHYRLLFDHQVKRYFALRSVHWADAVVAPSRSFADDLQHWTNKPINDIHHGFDPNTFFADRSALPADMQQKLASAQGALRLLFVSHYNYYRNFETLLAALPLLRARLGKKIRLFLTCKLGADDNGYRSGRAARLVRQLGIEEEVVDLGTVPYRLLHHVYEACDVYVTAAYAESFAHPLVEAMASRLAIIASDLPVHREICGHAALYFDCFSPEDLCAQILRVAGTPGLRQELAMQGQTRSLDFSWAKHVNTLLTLAATLVRLPQNLSESLDLMGKCSRDVQTVGDVGQAGKLPACLT
jgi:glycosyltransferase involved in cell wall biosynthesis